MLLLRLQTPKNRFLLDASVITEIIPLVFYHKVAHSPAYLVGMINFRGQPVPVVDLGLLLEEVPCQERMNTRIILVKVALNDDKKLLLGIIAENISGTLRLEKTPADSSEMLPQELSDSTESEEQQ
ncbi:MAG: chemotaxis protein CheW [Deltaproteobacteria bacterium]